MKGPLLFDKLNVTISEQKARYESQLEVVAKVATLLHKKIVEIAGGSTENYSFEHPVDMVDEPKKFQEYILALPENKFAIIFFISAGMTFSYNLAFSKVTENLVDVEVIGENEVRCTIKLDGPQDATSNKLAIFITQLFSLATKKITNDPRLTTTNDTIDINPLEFGEADEE